MKRVLFSFACGLALFAAAAGGAEDQGVALRYERALYPDGMPMRRNELSGNEERPAFVLHSRAALPKTSREVVVWSERLDKGMPFEKLYRVFAAVLETGGEGLRVLDRRELTAGVPLFLEVPGHVFELRALATPLPKPEADTVAVELWASLHGTGFYNAASDLFFSVDGAGKLAPVLTLKDTFASANVDLTLRSGETSTILVGTTPQTAGDIVVERRKARWMTSPESASVRSTCGPKQYSLYRFQGRTYEATASAQAPPGSGYVALPRLPILEKTSCN